MSPKTVNLVLFVLVAAAAVIVLTDPAFASSGGGLPWETPLNKLKDSLSGPVALAVGVIAFFAGGAMLVFGGEMTELPAAQPSSCWPAASFWAAATC